MKLVGSKTSPYVRKIRVMLAELAVPFEFIEENAWSKDTTVPRYNPLNKVPALVLDSGEAIFDSAVISEYLDAVGGGRFIPAAAEARALARRDEALGDGIADAGIAVFLERKREPARQDPAWIARQHDKMNAGVAALSRRLQGREWVGGEGMGVGDIACACALFWTEFRMPDLKLRDAQPNVAAWAARMQSRPSFAATRPDAP